MKNKFYITTPLYYPNDNLHIGHAYSTVIADVLARYKKNCGYDVRFLIGSDEHGEKIEKKAKENNKEPLDFVNGIIKNFISL
jgi:methionyl-tRNA synthetase